MIFLPDDTKIDMQWKKVTYIRDDNYAVFEVIPMLQGEDIVVFLIFLIGLLGKIFFHIMEPHIQREY